MSSIGTSPHPFTSAPTEGRALVRFLRHPSEPLAFAACVIANVAVIAIASGLVLAGTESLAAYPFVANRVAELRIITIAAVISFPATFIGRHVALHEARGNGVRVTAEAYPELYAELVRISRVLGVDPVPELYLGRVKGAPAAAHAVVGQPSCVVLDADSIFDKEWTEGSDWISFVLAGALGSIRLGHTRWWVEIFTAYAKRIPGVRSPLLVAWTFSRDRCAAFAVPGAVRGILIEAVGKDMIWNIDIEAFLRQPREHGAWGWLSSVTRKTPHVVDRVGALYDAGFWSRPPADGRSQRARPVT